MKEHCGIVGVYSFGSTQAPRLILRGLEALQHRGQESWGVALLGGGVHKRLGLISDTPQDYLKWIEEIPRSAGIGHVRYSTKGKTSLENAHPIEIASDLAVAQNGTIENADELTEELHGAYSLRTTTDTEVLGAYLAMLHARNGDWTKTFQEASAKINGSYSLMALTSNEEILAARDERGFRPLCLGWQKETNSYIIASESCSLDALGGEMIRDVLPGELIIVSSGGYSSRRFATAESTAHCSFEYTYFAHPSSLIDGAYVYAIRKRIGRLLARKFPLRGDVVIPVPDSARPAALGFAEESHIPLEEGLMKNRYRRKGSMRSFIEPTQGEREEIVKQVIAIRPTVEGKDIILVDDSVVRGTSSRFLISLLKKAGAKSVSVVLTFPPIRSPCYMGIDFPTQEELIAHQVGAGIDDVNEIGRRVAEEIGADFLGYNDPEGLAQAIGKPLTSLCMSCHTGNYGCLKSPPRFRRTEEMKC